MEKTQEKTAYYDETEAQVLTKKETEKVSR